MPESKKNLYEILGVPRDATGIDIGLAYRRQIAAADRAIPPDPTRQALLHEANEILSNPKRRAAYDASLVTAAEKAAALEQAATPDLDLSGEPDETPARRKLPWIPIALAIIVVLVGAFFTLRTPPPSDKVAEQPQPVKPAPPPPPQPKTSAQILTSALASVGRVLTYDMSGRMTPAGLAIAVDTNAMVTTCEGVRAGAQLVVKLGAESHSATLTITDETVGLCQLLVPGATLKLMPVSPEPARQGDTIHALGANEKGDMALTEGVVKEIRNTPAGPLMEVSMPIASAGSGGAIFDRYGRVVGIATHRAGAGVPTALPASALSQLRSRAKPQ